ncbi:pyridoxamine 5'-phosphate oxidase family protein [Halalkaliarchaeum sp. AArc-GB]|uniref:pyridoxamine 5'-phosphate oxidase family protein n=1 Tax=unclassified Halalkaliarchaeum TaxID=2678344 RepID=UPI00217EEF58|nr:MULTISPECIES: pyridoxamine 5'-phosphate oxidase family protein [unclassified Halalkaliarchaeum]MDR5673431.1 pyridoxamine 5'-phosphate oxidase family protein [Halalkaliarchaeum sp. AArc-GB]
MALDQQTEMAPDEIEELLGRHETAVLSLANADEPYAIPISYGYDPDSNRFYFRLVSTPESEKRAFLTSSPRARIVVYEELEPTYRSVVADGTLERIDPDEMSVEHVVQYGGAKRPLFEIWGKSKRELDIQLYQLDIESIGGRRIDLEEREDDPVGE